MAVSEGLRSRRALAVLAALALVSTAMFVPTYRTHVATLEAQTTDARALDDELTAATLVVEMELSNPAARPLVLFAARVVARGPDGRRLTELAGATVEEVTVPAGGTATARFRLDVDPERRAALERAVANGSYTVSGTLYGRVERAEVRVRVEVQAPDGTADGDGGETDG